MKLKVRLAHLNDGAHVCGTVRSSISTTGKGGAGKVDDIEATPVGLLVRLGEAVSLVPWGQVKSCPEVEVVDEKPKGAK